MAKSKRKRPRRPPGGVQAGSSSRGTSSRPAPGSVPRRPQAELEVRRRRAAELEREVRRRRLQRTGLAAGAVVVSVVLVGALLVYAHRLNGTERMLLAQAPAAATTAGCTGVRAVPPFSPENEDRSHIGGSAELDTMPLLSRYRSVPPASGPHDPIPLGAGVYDAPPPIGRTIHSLEHAAVIIWYSPAAGGGELQRIRDFFTRGNESQKVIVAPFQYPDAGRFGRLPGSRQVALVAWHRLQYCDRPSLPVAYSFVHLFRFNMYQWGAYKGVAPEKGAGI